MKFVDDDDDDDIVMLHHTHWKLWRKIPYLYLWGGEHAVQRWGHTQFRSNAHLCSPR